MIHCPKQVRDFVVAPIREDGFLKGTIRRALRIADIPDIVQIGHGQRALTLR